MNFTAKNLNNPSLYPRDASVTVGRLKVRLHLGQGIYDGLRWEIENAHDVIREGDALPASGKISRNHDPLESVMLLLSELTRYDRHLEIEEEIARDPAGYRKKAEAAIKAEEKAVEEEAKRQAKLAEEEAQRIADLEAVEEAARISEAEAAAEEEAERLRAERRAKLERRIREAAARALSA